MARNRWPAGLSLVGLSLGLLPLLQGQWRVAVVAAIVGSVVLAGWSIGTSSDRHVGIAVGAGLAATMVALFVVSQWPRDQLTPPYVDWLLGWLLVGLGSMVGLIVDASVNRARARRLARPALPAGAPGVAVAMIARVISRLPGERRDPSLDRPLSLAAHRPVTTRRGHHLRRQRVTFGMGGAGHFPFSEEPEAFHAAIKAFLDCEPWDHT